MQDKDFPSVEALLEAGAHFGHVVKRWNPKMEPYLYGERNGIHIFDLFMTREKLVAACQFLEEAVSQGKRVIFVGTKGQAVDVVREEAMRLGLPYVVNRWIGGTLTNWSEIQGRVEALTKMREDMERGAYEKYTKKEQVLKKRDIERLERLFGGLVGLTAKPDILFVVDPNRETTAVSEAVATGIAVVAIADSNANPDPLAYVIPANDDALKSVTMLVSSVAKAIEAGQTKARKSTTKKEAASKSSKEKTQKPKAKK